jgi:F-type H+-transporting ATPase subunit b
MDFVFNKEFGTIFWTLFNFGVFLFVLRLILKVQIKPNLEKRQQRINDDIKNAHKANQDAQALLKESEEKVANAYKEMSEIIGKGKLQAEEIVRKATDEAENVKKAKVAEALREIDRSKDSAIKELRKEMADLVVMATGKMIKETLDKEKHIKLIDSYIEKLPKN